jgi:Ger(x)C family germination protein
VGKYRKVIPWLAVLLCSITLSGCWDAKELDDLAVPVVGALDTVLESEKEYPDDKYLFTVGFPVFYENVEERFHVIETKGKTMGDTRGRRNSQLGEQVMFGQFQILILGEELAKKENLLEVLDIFNRNTAIKASLLLAIVKGRAADLMKKPVKDYPCMGIYLKALMETSKDVNFYPYTTLFYFNRELISHEAAVVLPQVEYKNGNIMLTGSCLVNKGKLAAELGRKETETVVMLRGIKCRGTLAFDVLKDEKVIDEVSFEGTNSRKVTVKRTGDKYAFNIQIKLTGVIAEHIRKEPIQDGTDYLKLIQVSLKENIKKRAEAIIEKTQEEYRFDALDLAKYIKAHTREKLTKEDIDRIVQESEINVEVKVKIQNAGGIM